MVSDESQMKSFYICFFLPVSITNESQFRFARILNSIFFFDTDETQAGVVLKKKTYDSGIHASQDDTW